MVIVTGFLPAAVRSDSAHALLHYGQLFQHRLYRREELELCRGVARVWDELCDLLLDLFQVRGAPWPAA